MLIIMLCILRFEYDNLIIFIFKIHNTINLTLDLSNVIDLVNEE